MSSGPSRPGSPPIPDLDDWSGSESGGLASKPVETTRGVEPQRDLTSEREVLSDTAHDVKDEAAENVNMGRIANRHHPGDSVSLQAELA